MKIHIYALAIALAMPLLDSCSEYNTAGYSSARVHVKTAPKSLERQVRPTPQPAPKPSYVRKAAPQPQYVPQAVSPQAPIPEKLLAPTPAPKPAAVAPPAPAPKPTPVVLPTSAPKRDYPVMPGQNRRLKVR